VAVQTGWSRTWNDESSRIATKQTTVSSTDVLYLLPIEKPILSILHSTEERDS
jgi:hypothetical protein